MVETISFSCRSNAVLEASAKKHVLKIKNQIRTRLTWNGILYLKNLNSDTKKICTFPYGVNTTPTHQSSLPSFQRQAAASPAETYDADHTTLRQKCVRRIFVFQTPRNVLLISWPGLHQMNTSPTWLTRPTAQNPHGGGEQSPLRSCNGPHTVPRGGNQQHPLLLKLSVKEPVALTLQFIHTEIPQACAGA